MEWSAASDIFPSDTLLEHAPPIEGPPPGVRVVGPEASGEAVQQEAAPDRGGYGEDPANS